MALRRVAQALYSFPLAGEEPLMYSGSSTPTPSTPLSTPLSGSRTYSTSSPSLPLAEGIYDPFGRGVSYNTYGVASSTTKRYPEPSEIFSNAWRPTGAETTVAGKMAAAAYNNSRPQTASYTTVQGSMPWNSSIVATHSYEYSTPFQGLQGGKTITETSGLGYNDWAFDGPYMKYQYDMGGMSNSRSGMYPYNTDAYPASYSSGSASEFFRKATSHNVLYDDWSEMPASYTAPKPVTVSLNFSRSGGMSYSGTTTLRF
jgi:hypothetical protein